MNEEKKINQDLVERVENDPLVKHLRKAPQIESLELRGVRTITEDIISATYYAKLREGHSRDLQNYISQKTPITGCGPFTYEDNTYWSIKFSNDKTRVRVRVLSDYDIRPVRPEDLIIS